MNYEKLFEEKSGYSLEELSGEHCYRYNTPYGFFAVELGGKDFYCVAVSGNGEVLIPYICEKAKELGYERVLFRTKRNPKAWDRKYNCKVVEYVMAKEI